MPESYHPQPVASMEGFEMFYQHYQRWYWTNNCCPKEQQHCNVVGGGDGDGDDGDGGDGESPSPPLVMEVMVMVMVCKMVAPATLAQPVKVLYHPT